MRLVRTKNLDDSAGTDRDDTPHGVSYQELRDQGQRAQEDGRWSEALELFQRAYDCAQAKGDADLVDRAYCNLTLPRIELGLGQSCLTRLRQILTCSRNTEVCYLAAYNIGRIYTLNKQTEKGLFHLRIALKRAEQLGFDHWRAAAFNRIGNLLLAESRATEALEAYQTALGLLPQAPSVFRGTILGNLGYCHLLEGELPEAFDLLYRGLRMLRANDGEKKTLLSVRLDLAFAHLEADRPRSAARHARAGLALARQTGDRQSIKNALYMLGESSKLQWDYDQARQYFLELQEFYPELPAVTDYLIAFDLRGLINLRA